MPTDTSNQAQDEAAALAELDLRALPCPEPMLRALAAADALRPGQQVQVLTPLLPTPLLDVLAARGLQATATPLPAGAARVVIYCPFDDDETAA
ncbi:MAG: DUF2249 domain-containing protein [Rhodanobacter sp.]|nr:MAG: DUF2249 domain-containing protein [Rhodanobacter sp.]TAL98454.1 MAG: DUF2249 domain-containing protein [Rhodanobacter sp.]TAM38660.1 MAG: DUF2249 domain-containing protein [Rhodanobacter sp.]TAN23685.1 MAG: DUF2249 domain-containing protein [Rhodanobacter sp.]